MVLPGMVMTDWISMVMCTCGHLASRHVMHKPDYPMEPTVTLGSCKECPPFDPENVIGCDGFTPRTKADADKLMRALGIASAEQLDKMAADAQEIMDMEFPQVDMSKTLAVGNQSKPKGEGREITPLVIADMQARERFGKEKYGEGLTAFNGRDALQDAYQEALDLVVYLRQLIEERDSDHPMSGPIEAPSE